jgi:hypothetical protein
MNAIDALGPKAAPLIDFIRTMPTRDPRAGSRVNQYMGQLKTDFLARFEPSKVDAASKVVKPKRKQAAK